MEIKIGTSGWVYDDFIGKFYPKSLDKKEYLSFYASKFNAVEVNSTFYRFLFPNIIKSWDAKTPKDFEFVLKGHRIITHIKKLTNAEKYIESFFKLANLIKKKTKLILWQMPPSFKFSEENLIKLKKFCLQVKKYPYKHVIEFREKNWWRENVYDFCKENKLVFCSVSAPGLPEDFIVTNETAYLRFHGKTDWYAHNYSEKELKEWSEKIKKSNAKQVYVFFNNTMNAYAIENAIKLNLITRQHY